MLSFLVLALENVFLLMSFFLLSHKSAVGRIMLLEVTIRYLV